MSPYVRGLGAGPEWPCRRPGTWILMALVMASGAHASEIGQIKVSRGQVSVERSGQAMPGVVGLRLQAADRLRTGADGSVGITMNDDSLLSAGPNSVLSLDQFALDSNASQGRFASTLNRGSLAVVSGRIAKSSPDAMTVRTPRAVLGVRGTEFVVRVDE